MHSQDYDSRMFVTSHEAKEIVDDNTVVVVVDTNRPGYTECEELLYMTKTIVVLDHHRQSKDIIQNAVLSYIEPYASSACEMVAEILQYFADGIRIRNIEADSLYAGIMIDTNNFLTKTGVRTFEAAAFLRRCGADVTRVRKMFREHVEDYRAKGEAIRNAELFREHFAISVCPSEGLDSPTVVGAQAANELLNIIGAKGIFCADRLSQYDLYQCKIHRRNKCTDCDGTPWRWRAPEYRGSAVGALLYYRGERCTETDFTENAR